MDRSLTAAIVGSANGASALRRNSGPIGKGVTPFSRETRQWQRRNNFRPQIRQSPLAGETWCTSFTTVENEMAALDHFIQMFRGYGYIASALKLECMKVGALLRGVCLDEAKTMLARLDQVWAGNI
jgi:hypothetical protein